MVWGDWCFTQRIRLTRTRDPRLVLWAEVPQRELCVLGRFPQFCIFNTQIAGRSTHVHFLVYSLFLPEFYKMQVQILSLTFIC